MGVVRQYRELRQRRLEVEVDQSRVIFERDRLIQEFDDLYGGLRLPMRLRRRSGGLLAWRNTARNGRAQRDRDLDQYRTELERLPQTVRAGLLRLEKQRILVNFNLSMLAHEMRQLEQALEKIARSETTGAQA